MLTYPPPRFEQQKSEVLQRYRILKSETVHDASHIARTAALALGTPIVIAALNERYRAWYRAAHGVTDNDFHNLQEFCAYANLSDDAFAVADARLEPYFAREPAVMGAPNVVFFAGAPLSDPDGKRFGTLCLIGNQPRSPAPGQIELLKSMAHIVSQDICVHSAGRYAVQGLINAEEERCALYDLAVTDPLTKALNHRAFFRFAEREVQRAQRHHHPVSVLMFDIDHFKKVNDIHGHAAGDEVIIRLSRLVTECVREADLLGRLGGEEFGLILPETSLEAAVTLANRLREAVKDLRFKSSEGTFGVTISLGVSQPGDTETDIVPALDRADKALYRAKRFGRDRAELMPPAIAESACIIQLPLAHRASDAA
ncbi:GGDEF/GAF domain protein [Hyphomonas neptunium ATCC 15444]|uniref:diguanylate cyclase n=2 Tax=Hyphomonas TaxID=85 RepID=Q0BZP0_HYPNA|nr:MULTISPECIES: sensor domain-containing diguanylate cyclase [Hyphomonas]ABI77629.1 GGDEF/GAF domain protein [Hyphomonas neptunium ATCC 15444]KCZ86752.1 diguanylate cyclase [Hyphomonas hirschiana VP5]